MKTKGIIATCLMAAMLCVSNLSAQNANTGKQKKGQRPTTEERIAKRTEAMQQSLLLSGETATQFATIYKEYLTDLEKCRPEMKKPEELAKRTDAEIEKSIEDQFEWQKKRIETQETYYKKFKKILNARQLEQIFRAPSKAPQQMRGQRPQGKDKQPGKRPELPQMQPGE